MQSYELFLEGNPTYIGKVTMFLNTSSEVEISSMKNVSVLVNHINAKYGSVDSPAVHHLIQDLTMEEACAICSIAKVYVVSNVRGGVDLGPYEYVMCRERKKDARVILSVLSNTSTCLAG